jgi:uncharacterized damage-inducible protein DinB
MNTREIRRLEGAPPSKEAVIGEALMMLFDCRSRTKAALSGLSVEGLNWRRSPQDSSIGDLLYHVAFVEADWLYDDVMGIEYPGRIRAMLPQDIRDSAGRLIHAPREPLASHIERLDAIREELFSVFSPMGIDDFRRLRERDRYDVSPEWVLHHLLQHEAEHRGQMKIIRKDAE